MHIRVRVWSFTSVRLTIWRVVHHMQSACVVTERTRLGLPGAAYGYVPESFSSYQLARLPQGVGAYLALTGAELSGPELVRLQLATHITESHAVDNVERILSEQP